MTRTTVSDRTKPSAAAADQTLEVAASPKARPEQGICISCNHRPTCLFRKAARHPIFFCEEFEDRVISGEPLAVAQPIEAVPAEPTINYGEAQELGLCANCTTKTNCMNRQPGVAVWHCEDYS